MYYQELRLLGSRRTAVATSPFPARRFRTEQHRQEHPMDAKKGSEEHCRVAFPLVHRVAHLQIRSQVEDLRALAGQLGRWLRSRWSQMLLSGVVALSGRTGFRPERLLFR